jgi:hypothetical protein
MALGRVLQCDDRRGVGRIDAEFFGGLLRVGEQALLERGIDPGAGDDLRPGRSPPRVQPLDLAADVGGGQQALGDHQLAHRALEPRVFRPWLGVIVRVVVVMAAAHASFSSQVS